MRVGAQEVPHLVAIRHAGHGQQVLQVIVQVGPPLRDEAAVQVWAQVAFGGSFGVYWGRFFRRRWSTSKLRYLQRFCFLVRRNGWSASSPLCNRGTFTNRPGDKYCEAFLGS